MLYMKAGRILNVAGTDSSCRVAQSSISTSWREMLNYDDSFTFSNSMDMCNIGDVEILSLGCLFEF